MSVRGEINERKGKKEKKCKIPSLITERDHAIPFQTFAFQSTTTDKIALASAVKNV